MAFWIKSGLSNQQKTINATDYSNVFVVYLLAAGSVPIIPM